MDKYSSDLHVIYNADLTEKNIDYAFQRLVLPIIAATGFKPYNQSKNDFSKILSTIINWIIIYANTKDLTKINFDEFISIRQHLFDLDTKYSMDDGYYAEEAYEWALQLQVLLEKSIMERNNKNGI